MMFSISKFVALLCVLISLGDASPKVVSMRMYRRERDLVQKRSASPVLLGNAVNIGLYYVNASVGTPSQEVSLQIDTGSSDVWMFGPKSCDPTTSPCLGGAFDYSKSSSATLLSQGGFSISYVTPGSGVAGDYISDNFAIGSIKISNLTMAVATDAKNVPTGIMGIGFDTDESIVSNGGKPYPNIIDVMVSEGLIGARAYSLYLDDLDDSTGTVLFGGYDTDKYTGDLTVLEIFPDAQSGTISSMTVAWTSFAVTDSSGTTQLGTGEFPLPAILDSGTTHTVLPPDIYGPLADYFGVVSDDTYGNLVSCDIGNTKGTLDFGFGGKGGAVISVTYAELALPARNTDGNPLQFEDGSAACHFGLDPADTNEPLLFGDTFLRSAYVVYDLDAQQIGIAPTKFESTTSNIVEIGKGDVGGVSSVASGVTVKQTATGKVPVSVVNTKSATASKVQTTAHTGILGSGISGVTQTGTTGTASATSSSKATSLAAPSLTSAFDVKNILIIGGSFVMMLFGGALVVFN